VMMPHMGGRQLAEGLAATRTDMKVLFMTGYTDDAVLRQAVLDSDAELLQKPIMPHSLTQRVRAVLDTPARVVSEVFPKSR
jgi:two-component system cell cycle sensor histidine kinase/response regulator CckA